MRFNKVLPFNLSNKLMNKYNTIYTKNKKIQAVILDFSGTIIDPFVIAPSLSFVEVLKKYGIIVSMEQIRPYIGSKNELNVTKLFENNSIKNQWINIHKKNIDSEDIKIINNDTLQIDMLNKYGILIPGVNNTIKTLQEQKIKIGITTQFNNNMCDVILKKNKPYGFNPDCCISSDDVHIKSKTNPFMIYESLKKLNVYPIHNVIKVDSTISGIKQGLNAGCWTVGVYKYSNYVNINSLEEWNNLSQEEQNDKCNDSKKILETSGAHFIAPDITYLPSIINTINFKLKK